jgi:HK97 gp10 family phage protein
MPRAEIKMDTSSLNHLIKAMEELDRKVRNNALRKALKEGRSIYLKAARTLVPTKYKVLKKSLGFREKFKFAKGFAYSVIGPKRRAGKTIKGLERIPTKYAHLVEFGAAPHTIGRGDITSDILLAAKRKYKSTGLPHPGSRPKPFLRPAWDQNKSKILSEMEKILKSAIEGGSV